MKTTQKTVICIILLIFIMSFFSIDIALGFDKTWIIDKIPSSWTTDNGFPVNGAVDILQSSEGYIWIGTYDGLVRFDGIKFKLFNKYSGDGFNCSSARILYEDKDNKLWIGTNESGISILDNGSFTTLSTSNGLPGNSIRCITGDGKGNIWVGTSHGMAEIIGDNIINSWSIDELNSFSVIDILVDSDGFVWAISQEGNIYVNKGSQFAKFQSPDIFQGDRVQKIFQDSRGNIWFGTVSGNIICRSNDDSYRIYTSQKELSAYYINDIFEDHEGVICFCSDQGIAFLGDNDEFFTFTQKDGLINNSIESICQDREGNFWVASSRAGIQKISYGKFANYTVTRGLRDNVVNVITKDHTGIYWIGTDTGLSLLQNNRFIKNELTEFLQGIRIRHIYEDSKNRIWISTYSDYGLILYDGKITTINKDDGLSANTVRLVFEDSQHNIWAGTKAGINLIKDDEVKRIYTEADGLADYILCINETAQGEILLGTDGGGLFILKDDLISNYTCENGLAGNIVFKSFSDNHGQTWIATNEGVSLWREDGSFFNYTVKDGLLSDSIFDILEDDENRFWFTCSQGVFNINKDDLIKYSRGQTAELPLQVFDRTDGLLDGITPASWSMFDDSSMLWFATTRGISSFDTRNIHINSIPPKIVIEEVQTDDSTYVPGNLSSIDPQNKRINIRFTGLSFTVPDKVLFRYYLEGFDSGWSSPTSCREVSYTSLPYGDYTFHVMAANNDDIWSEDNCSFSFYQKPVFFETRAFAVFIYLFLIMAVYVIHTLKMKKLKQRKEKLRNILVDAITSLASAIDAKDSYTNGHSERVCEYSIKIGQAMGLKQENLERLEYMALLHDVGKIGIQDSILNKDSKLSEEEYQIMQQHPEIGANILCRGKSLEEIAVGAKYHHERYDGKGYCEGLKGDEIPLEARIIAIADAYDAMTHDRPYRKSLGHSEAVKEINRCAGSQFDPQIVRYFNKALA